jgi:enolase
MARSGGLLSRLAHQLASMRQSSFAMTDKLRYFGEGTKKAAENISKTTSPALAGFDASNLTLIDRTMLALDGTPNRLNLAQTQSWQFPWRQLGHAPSQK